LAAQVVRPLPDPTRSAELYASELAAASEEARLMGEEAGGVCLDLSKAYDRLPLTLLECVAEQSGVGKWLSGPALSMYRGDRMIRVGTACGEWRSPTEGLPPGCPHATRWIGAVLHHWRRLVAAAVADVQIRCWVDDSTAWARTRARILRVARISCRGMVEMERTGACLVNRKKEMFLLASSLALQQEMVGNDVHL